jgi:hypothetical protein
MVVSRLAHAYPINTGSPNCDGFPQTINLRQPDRHGLAFEVVVAYTIFWHIAMN